MSHWRQRHDHDLAKLKRRDADFDLALKLTTIGLICAALLAYGIALS